jgi:cytochrome P450
MIRERRAEFEDPACTTKNQVDFLSQLLQDDYFGNDDQKIKDECMTFIGAATQSQTFLITNTLYYLAKNQEVREKLMAELKVKLMPLVPPGASLQDETTWHTILT